MYCTKCGKEIDNNSSFCSNCGSPIKKETYINNTNTTTKNNKDINEMIIRCILSIFFIIFGCSGLIYNAGGLLIILGAFVLSPLFMILFKKFNKQVIRLVSNITSIILILVGMSIVCTSPEIGTSQNTNSPYSNTHKENIIKEDTSNVKKENVETENSNNIDNNSFYKKDNNISNTTSVNKDFGEGMLKSLTNLGFTIEEATEIQSIFYQIGINSISNIQAGGEDGIDKLVCYTAYANNDTKKKFYFTIEKRKMFYAGFMDSTLYDTSKGGVLTNINDVHIPETKVDMDTYTTLQVKAEEAIKQYLNYPDTANFPLYDGWGIGRSDDTYKIIGKVSAKNGFGVKSDMNFSVWFKKSNNQFIVEAIELNGIRVK